MAPKKQNKTQEKVNNKPQEMSQDSDHADEREMEDDDDSESTKVTELNPSNADVLQAIKEMDKRVTSKIDGVMSAIKEVKERVKEAEERISWERRMKSFNSEPTRTRLSHMLKN